MTVQDQSAVTNNEMLDDAFAALKALANHPRIDGKRVGIVGFSKGGTVALLAAHDRRARALPTELRFALHVPFYPSCSTQHYKPKSTGAPIYLLLGGADTYVGVAPCQEYAAVLKAEGARVEVTVYPGAAHGFDTGSAYRIAKGENYSKCVFAEQPDGTWKERISGATTIDAKGRATMQAETGPVSLPERWALAAGPTPRPRQRPWLTSRVMCSGTSVEGKWLAPWRRESLQSIRATRGLCPCPRLPSDRKRIVQHGCEKRDLLRGAA